MLSSRRRGERSVTDLTVGHTREADNARKCSMFLALRDRRDPVRKRKVAHVVFRRTAD